MENMRDMQDIELIKKLIRKRWFTRAVGSGYVRMFEKMVRIVENVTGSMDISLDMDTALRVGSYLLMHYVLDGRCMICSGEIRDAFTALNHFKRNHGNLLKKILVKMGIRV